MHGIVRPRSDEVVARPDRLELIKRQARKHRRFLLFVMLPTLLIAAYYYLIASDQYESEADFVVRSTQQSRTPASGISSLLAAGGLSPSNGDTMSVVDYLKSTEATLAMERSTGIGERFSRSDIDIVSRLRSYPASPEKLHKYYNRQVTIKLDKETGITKLTVHAFRPADAYRIAQDMLRLGEQRVNQLNQRSFSDALGSANRQLSEAETDLRSIQVQMTAFRRSRGDIDPDASGKAQIAMVNQLTVSLASAQAQLQAMRGLIAPNSPQYVATQARVRALAGQVAGQEGRLAGHGSTMATTLGDYEGLRVKQEFAMKRYDLAAAAYQAAREDARKKELYLVPVVNPNMPVEALFPERGRIVLTVFAMLLLAFGIGSLLISGVKEHANT